MIDTLLTRPEGKTLEFKRDLSSPRPMLKTLGAFANTAGGRLVIGVDEQIRVTPDEIPVETPVGTKSAPSRHQVEILQKCLSDSPIGEIMEIAGRADRTKLRNQVLQPLLDAGLMAMTLPDKPNSRLQKVPNHGEGQKDEG